MRRLVALAGLLLTLGGCSNTKNLPGGFELLKWEDGSMYYLVGPNGKNKDGGGAIEGTVLRLAWNNDLIAAERNSIFRGDKDGWIIIDAKTKNISGPVSEEAFSELRDRHQLQVMSATDAWQKL
ncbi:hypothetical protein EGT07_01690 [Herbaspirillum sp. HC18]|nr:hypothetical protein EGT07_01690 [Herbaspirillum sp. HC18]